MMDIHEKFIYDDYDNDCFNKELYDELFKIAINY